MIEFNDLKINNGEAFHKDKWNGLLEWVAENPLNLTNQKLELTTPDSSSSLRIEAQNNFSLIETQHSKPLVINSNKNRVGIGTTNPSATLDVHGTLKTGEPGNGKVLLLFNSERSWAFRQLGSGSSTKLELASIGGGGNKSFIINTTGNVGIGTTNPKADLEVAGTIKAASYTYTGNASHKLIHFKTYKNIGNSVDTGFRSRDWNAAIVGFISGSGDIQENDSGNIFSMFMTIRGSTWRISADFRTHRKHENWTVYAMFVRKEISTR